MTNDVAEESKRYWTEGEAGAGSRSLYEGDYLLIELLMLD